MSDTDPTTDPTTDPKPNPDPADKDPDWKAEAEKWKAMSRKHEQQAKANADAAKKLAEAEDADKSEIQKAADRAAQAEKRAEEAERHALRLEVAGEKGLTSAQATRLVGATKEELESDADELLESFKPAGDNDDGKSKPLGGKPKEKLSGGGDPTEEPEPDAREIVEKIPRF